MVLSEDARGRALLLRRLSDLLSTSKTWGKGLESLPAIAQAFADDLGCYTFAEVEAAIKIHSMHCADFPTTADVAGIIRRGGAAEPIPKEIYIAKQQIAPEVRTREDWDLIRRYEAQKLASTSACIGFEDGASAASRLAENIELRKKLAAAEAENKRAWARVRELETEVKRVYEHFRKT